MWAFLTPCSSARLRRARRYSVRSASSDDVNGGGVTIVSPCRARGFLDREFLTDGQPWDFLLGVSMD